MNEKETNMAGQESGQDAAQQATFRPEFKALLQFLGQCIADDEIMLIKGSSHGNEQ